jgi:hypothetical protein
MEYHIDEGMRKVFGLISMANTKHPSPPTRRRESFDMDEVNMVGEHWIW